MRLWTLLLCLFVLPVIVFGAEPAIDRPSLQINRATGPIQVDGHLSETAWRDAAVTDDFMQFLPVDKVRPKVATTAYATYDDRNLYLGFICYDDPDKVRATLTDRDRMYSDDFVGIILDTYGDAAWAYEFYANPLGVQGDLRWLASGEEDSRFDVVYHTGAHITDSGWQAEIAIPFSSLRFPERDEQSWRAAFWRSHPRESMFKYSWPPLELGLPCLLCDLAHWTGMRNVTPGSKLDLLPSIIGYQSGSRDNDDLATPFYNADPDAEGELDIRYHLTQGLAVEATVNPDFSQVESDAARIDVNTTFALDYAERRPFFQEGSDLYGADLRAIYTRAINDPSAAFKLTGRQGRTSYFFLSAADEHSPLLIPLEEGTAFVAVGKSYSNVGRVRRTFADDSHIGALVTDRRLDAGNGANSVYGGDAAVRFFEKYRLAAQVLGSQVREADNPQLSEEYLDDPGATFDDGRRTVRLDGESYGGFASRVQLRRRARMWNFDLGHTAVSPAFRADNGFITRSAFQEADFWTGLQVRPDGRAIVMIEPSLLLGRIWTWEGGRKDEWAAPAIGIGLARQLQFKVLMLFSRELFRGVWFDDIRRIEAEMSSSTFDRFRLGAGIVYGNAIARKAVPVLGRELTIGLEATIKPLRQFTIEPTWEYYRLRNRDTGERIEEGYISRTRLNYQFTRELFARLVVQYDDFNDRLSFEPLVTYKVNPFTIFYIGSASRYGWDKPSEIEGRLIDRQFFVKLQYLFRV